MAGLFGECLVCVAKDATIASKQGEIEFLRAENARLQDKLLSVVDPLLQLRTAQAERMRAAAAAKPEGEAAKPANRGPLGAALYRVRRADRPSDEEKARVNVQPDAAAIERSFDTK